MNIQNKKEVIELTHLVIIEFLHEEEEVYNIFSNDFINEILSPKKSKIHEHSHFGGEDNLESYYVLAIIAWCSKFLLEQGLSISKVVLNDWFSKNKKKILERFPEEKHQYAIKIIDEFLKK